MVVEPGPAVGGLQVRHHEDRNCTDIHSFARGGLRKLGSIPGRPNEQFGAASTTQRARGSVLLSRCRPAYPRPTSPRPEAPLRRYPQTKAILEASESPCPAIPAIQGYSGRAPMTALLAAGVPKLFQNGLRGGLYERPTAGVGLSAGGRLDGTYQSIRIVNGATAYAGWSWKILVQRWTPKNSCHCNEWARWFAGRLPGGGLAGGSVFEGIAGRGACRRRWRSDSTAMLS